MRYVKGEAGRLADGSVVGRPRRRAVQELTKIVALAGLDEGLANCSLSLDDAVRDGVVWGRRRMPHLFVSQSSAATYGDPSPQRICEKFHGHRNLPHAHPRVALYAPLSKMFNVRVHHSGCWC